MNYNKGMKTLHDINAVLEVLDGTGAVARLTGKSPASISNAKRRGWFPRDAHAVMTEHLETLGYTAPASLWKQIGPSHNESGQ